MKNILDIGQMGAEHMDVVAPAPDLAASDVWQYAQLVSRFPTTRISAEVNDGTRKDIEVHQLLMDNPAVFGLVRAMAPYEPMVFARKGRAQNQRTAMGILSPNFDEQGISALPSVKVLALRQPHPLISRGSDLLPDARTATMLAGSAHAEGKGSGGHDKPPNQDYEHKLTILGAVSLGNTTINGNDGRHVQHAVRATSSVATGLSNGKLGTIFDASGDQRTVFAGYDMPLVFEPGRSLPTDAIYIPKGFLDQEAAYGVYYVGAARIAYGASLQILYDRRGQQAVSGQLQQIGDTV